MVIIAIAGIFAPEPSFDCDFSKIDAADVAWLITATIFVLMMTPGLSFFYGGMVGAKNVISTMLQSFIAMGIISVLWVVFGFSLCFGDDIGGVIGDPTTFLMFNNVGGEVYTTPTGKILGGATIPLALFALFQMKFAIITPSLITGSFAERVRFSGYMFFMIFFFVVIYCPLAHMTWHPDGLFLKWGVVDFAGGIVVHASSGVAALAGAIFLGRRKASTRKSEPANIPFVLLGAAMLWLGWFGFNAGSGLAADGLAANAFLVTHIATAAAATTWMLIDWIVNKKPTTVGACTGAVAGLVAITPAAGSTDILGAFCIGIISTIVCFFMVAVVKEKFKYDDALDAFGVHGMGGILGSILTGVFATRYVTGAEGVEGALYGDWHQLWIQVVATVVSIIYSIVVTFIIFKVVDKTVGVRVDKRVEEEGLDIYEHGESAYSN